MRSVVHVWFPARRRASAFALETRPLDLLEKVVVRCEQRREVILNGLCESSRQLRSCEASAEPSGNSCQKIKHASTRKIRPVPAGKTRYATPAQVAASPRRLKHDERRLIRRLKDQKRANRTDLAAGCQERAAGCYARTQRRHCPELLADPIAGTRRTITLMTPRRKSATHRTHADAERHPTSLRYSQEVSGSSDRSVRHSAHKAVGSFRWSNCLLARSN